MKLTQVVGLVNTKLAGETLTYNQMLSFLDDTINDINIQLNACFPTFSELYPTLQTDAVYDKFPDQYIASVVVVGAALKFYTTDEEGLSVATGFQQEYDRGLFYMIRDYSASVPEQYQASHRGYLEGPAPSGIGAIYTNGTWGTPINPEIRYVEGPRGMTGPPGLKGDKGDKGDKGEKGDTGPQGEKGDDAEIFTVNFNRIGYDEVISDKKFEEICEALDAGKTVVGHQNGYVSQLMMRIGNVELLFLETQYGGQHVIYDMIPGFYDDAGNQLLYATTYDYATKAYVEDAIVDSEEVLIVHVNIDENGTITKDKTYAEVKAAIDSGKIVKMIGTMAQNSGTLELQLVAKDDTNDTIFFQSVGETWYAVYLYEDESTHVFMGQYMTIQEGSALDTRITSLETDVGDIENALAETKAIAKGRATGYVFDTVDDMYTWLADSNNIANIVLGDNLYIKAKDVPDYWWDGFAAQELETQKVNLTEYATKEWSENYINETILGGAW